MPTDIQKIDQLIQFSLLVAGEEDDYTLRELGPIHLIKYVYLADLAFAERNSGNTFTGVDWQFFKFGPWSQLVHQRIDPALTAISADKKVFESQYEGKEDWYRWQCTDEYRRGSVERKLPIVVISNLKRFIHKFGKDTPALLDHVYLTKPMLNAAPMEFLDFSVGVMEKDRLENTKTKISGLSGKKVKQLKERMLALRAKNITKTKSKPKLVNPVSSPRYDEVYEAGVKWLDEIAGRRPPEGKVTVNFSDEVWKSSARKGDEVP